MEIFSPVLWLKMMNSPGEDAPNTFTRALARSKSTATSIHRTPPSSTLSMSKGGNMELPFGRLRLSERTLNHRLGFLSIQSTTPLEWSFIAKLGRKTTTKYHCQDSSRSTFGFCPRPLQQN